MGRAPLLVVRETRSLGDALALLLESVGHHVQKADTAQGAARLLRGPNGRATRLIIVACNERDCRTLAELPPAFGTRPVLIVGSRAALPLSPPTGNIHRVGLPINTDRLLELVSSLASPTGLPNGEDPSVDPHAEPN